MKEAGRLDSVLGWVLTAVAGLGLGYAAISGKAYIDELEVRRNMTHRADFGALQAEFRGRPAVMVVRDGCRYCEMGRRWLEEQGLRVTEIQRASSPAVDAALSGLGVSGTPILLFPDRYVLGFEPGVWSKAFEERRGIQGRN